MGGACSTTEQGAACEVEEQDSVVQQQIEPPEGLGKVPLWKVEAEEQGKRAQEAEVAAAKAAEEAKAKAAQEAEAAAAAAAAAAADAAKEAETKAKAKAKAKTKATAKAKSKANAGPAEEPPLPAPAEAPEAKADAPKKRAKLTKAQAREALNKAMEIFELPENKEKLTQAVKSTQGDDMKKMATLMPMVQGMLKDLMATYGFEQDKMMLAVLQISGHADGDKKMSKQLARLQAALEGNFDFK
eukprot:TRINITY_DN35008_c0_g1_i1.p2 TRINITY_DN35008_c0_g1~~TRINITY_DN35008_c0_g1_i1.p2  ORF type:complete len:263 (+),score=108.73 TRINITY_DN35008_c0_g1_i1:62-790(+)